LKVDAPLEAGSPQVSVVVPAYNRVALLPRAIESVLHQTYQDFEIVVVDDGSTDGTARSLEGFRDSRIRCVRLSRRGGAARARNVGIRTARGEWIAFLDSDDEWLPPYLERQLSRLRAQPEAAVVSCPCSHEVGGVLTPRPRKPLPEGDVFDVLIMDQTRRSMTASAHIVRRDALLAVDCFDEQLPAANDLDLLLRLAGAGYLFAAVQEPLLIKHDHDLGQIRTDPMAQLRAAVRLERRWGPLVLEHRGRRKHRKWRRKRLRMVASGHAAYVDRLIASGTRGAAWRYVLEMVPHWRWGRRYIARALMFALLGRGRYAVRGVVWPAETPDR
jgi:glycosyltransferase involved in cell wall biosynthesis